MPNSPSPTPPRVAIWFLLGALFLSGLAAIVNQTVWQRSLKLYLAGCESASSMIVVLTFMAGLGAGSLCMGIAAGRVKNPLRLLGLVELALFAVNAAIAAALSLDLGESIYAVQRAAVSLGIPLRVVYGLSAAAVLLVPCFLMGVTMPLVSEAAQRQMYCRTSSFVAVLFVLNTLGSVAGCLVGGFLLMPYFGQRTSLLVGASCNCAAGLVLLSLYLLRYRRQAAPHSESGRAGPDSTGRHAPARSSLSRAGRLAPEEVLGFWFGFLSLGYEMYVFRVAALAHQPLPYNFSLVLCYYLLFWSAGVYLAKRIAECIPTLLVLSAAAVAAMPAFHLFDRSFLHGWIAERVLPGGLPLTVSAAVYCLPCVPFGCLFGQTIARFAKSWGQDVGRYYGLNTLGSCLGILAMTLLGYEINHVYAAALVAAGYVALLLYARRKMELPAVSRGGRRWLWGGWGVFAAGLLAVLPLSLLYALNREGLPRAQYFSWDNYYGKDGVVEVTDAGDMVWDGLWHSALSVDDSHVGTANWLLAAVPFLCHGGERIDDALVIGLGTGVTAATLARSDRVGAVDVYEIDHKLKVILRDYPEGTLGVADDPKVRLIWQDGRAGLALSDKQYDLITQQPLYLIQAGSSMLLSREYMELVKKRLKPGGIFCIYSNPASGSAEQALLVRRTAAEVFPYCESFGRGYAIIASDRPFTLHMERVATAGGDRLAAEVRAYGVEKMRRAFDHPRLDWNACPYVITDNHPLVEYPGVVRYLVGAAAE